MWMICGAAIQFQHLKFHPPFLDLEKRTEFQSKLKELLGVEISDDILNKRPSLSWEKLKTEDARKNFYEILDWAVKEIKIYEKGN